MCRVGSIPDGTEYWWGRKQPVTRSHYGPKRPVHLSTWNLPVWAAAGERVTTLCGAQVKASRCTADPTQVTCCACREKRNR